MNQNPWGARVANYNNMFKEWSINHSVEEEIAGQHETKNYRPTVVVAVQNSEGQLIVVKHPVGSWFFPQGGIEVGESLTGALRRELKEEVGVKGRITGIDLLFTKKLPYLPNRPGRDGFKVGKEYFVCKAQTPSGILMFRHEELAGSKWADKEEVLKISREIEQEKGGMIARVLAILGMR